MNNVPNKRLSLSSRDLAHRVRKYDQPRSKNAATRTSERATISHGNRRAVATRPHPLQTINAKQIQDKESVSKYRSPIISAGRKMSHQPTSASPSMSATQRLAIAAVNSSPAAHRSVIADQFNGALGGSYQPNMSRAQKIRQKIFYGMAATVFMFATFVSVQTLFTNQQTQQVLAEKSESSEQDNEGVAQGTGSDPAEEEVSDSAFINYQVAPELPRYLKIPKIGVFARVKHTGLDGTAVGAPTNIHDVSWFTDSSKPGNAIGSSLLLGHVQGWSAPGVFKEIDKLVPGDRFEVEKGSGETINYEVTRTQDIPLGEVNMAKILSAENPGEHDLKLMTCSGQYNRETEVYESRYVVYAKVLR